MIPTIVSLSRWRNGPDVALAGQSINNRIDLASGGAEDIPPGPRGPRWGLSPVGGVASGGDISCCSTSPACPQQPRILWPGPDPNCPGASRGGVGTLRADASRGSGFLQDAKGAMRGARTGKTGLRVAIVMRSCVRSPSADADLSCGARHPDAGSDCRIVRAPLVCAFWLMMD